MSCKRKQSARQNKFHYTYNMFVVYFLTQYLWNTRNPQLWISSGTRLSGKSEVGQYGTICTIKVGQYGTACAIQEGQYGPVHAI